MTSAGEGRWVVVSGGGGALGGALAAHFADAGRRVLSIDRQFNDLVSLTRRGVVAETIDASRESDVRESLDKVVAQDGISLLINAVGQIWNEPCLSLRGAKFVTHDIENWRRVMEANLTAPFIVASLVGARMARKRQGAIVNFSSIASGGNPGQAAYSAAKAGVEAWTRTMAAELGPLGVRVNAVALGFVDVASTRGALSESRLRDYVERTPVGRLGQVSDVIGAVEFLEGNSFVNGEVVKVDGGMRL